MKLISFAINDLFLPQILASEADFLLVYKPPKMHSVEGKGKSLVVWLLEKFPQSERLDKEAGLIHRLDFETHGIVLFARNQKAFDMFLEQQKNNEIIKEYDALVSVAQETKTGFPVFEKDILNFSNVPFQIKSLFRPYGPERKEVRPVDETAVRKTAAKKKAGSKIYTTEIIEIKPTEIKDIQHIRVIIQQGFRHQIRCHLAWARYPVLNDTVYGGKIYNGENPAQNILALRAKGISFCLGSGEKLSYSLPDIHF